MGGWRPPARANRQPPARRSKAASATARDGSEHSDANSNSPTLQRTTMNHHPTTTTFSFFSNSLSSFSSSSSSCFSLSFSSFLSSSFSSSLFLSKHSSPPQGCLTAVGFAQRRGHRCSQTRRGFADGTSHGPIARALSPPPPSGPGYGVRGRQRPLPGHRRPRTACACPMHWRRRHRWVPRGCSRDLACPRRRRRRRRHRRSAGT